MQSNYEIRMKSSDVFQAVEDFFKQRKETIKRKRIKAIREAMKMRSGLLFWKKPKFKNIRECIRYLKNDCDSWCGFSTWNRCAWTGAEWAGEVKNLVDSIRSTGQGYVNLSSEMHFLTTYIRKD